MEGAESMAAADPQRAGAAHSDQHAPGGERDAVHRQNGLPMGELAVWVSELPERVLPLSEGERGRDGGAPQPDIGIAGPPRDGALSVPVGGGDRQPKRENDSGGRTGAGLRWLQEGQGSQTPPLRGQSGPSVASAGRGGAPTRPRRGQTPPQRAAPPRPDAGLPRTGPWAPT